MEAKEGQGKDGVLQSKDHANSTKQSANTPLVSPTAIKSFRLFLLYGCIYSTDFFPSVCPFRAIKDMEDISNMATRLIAAVAENCHNIPKDRAKVQKNIVATPLK